MLHVGITGGIGSGKSTVARMFQLLGVPVYFADDEAKKLMNTDPAVRAGIISLFGENAYGAKGLNRPLIASVAFSDPEKLNALNAVVHPAVIAHAEQWMAKQKAPYTLKEAALLFESGSHSQLDFVIGVWAPPELRMERVKKRDGIGESEVLARMEKQMDEAEKMNRCDFVITNDEKQAVIPQVLMLHRKLLQST